MNALEEWTQEYLTKAVESMNKREAARGRGRSKKELITRSFMSGARKMQQEILKREMICCDRMVTVETIKNICDEESE